MKLSILICTIFSRRMLFAALENKLHSQILKYSGYNEVQVIFNNLQDKTTGWKRQELLKSATGDYIAFIDDDDDVYDWYIEEMLNACNSGLDCAAINGIMTTNGQHETRWFISKDYKNEDRREGNKTVYYRRTNHITAVRREIALRAGFPDKSNAEDKYYSDRLVLKTEYKIERPLYHYRFSTHNKSYK